MVWEWIDFQFETFIFRIEVVNVFEIPSPNGVSEIFFVWIRVRFTESGFPTDPVVVRSCRIARKIRANKAA